MNLTDGFFQTTVLPTIIRIIVALVIFGVSRRVARFAKKAITGALTKSALSESMTTLFTVLVYNGTLLFGILVALAVLGVPVTSLVAAGGVVLVLLGLALQESLSSFAATIMFMLFKPFTVDELIETNGILGHVQEIQLFNTVLLQGDQKMVTLPSAKVRDNVITNYSRMGTLRVDLEIGIGYGADLLKVKQILTELLEADERILADPAPQIVVKELSGSRIELAIWPFVNASDHWRVKCDLIEQIKMRFDEEGITIS